MARAPNATGEGSKKLGAKRGRAGRVKYTRYTEQQIKALEKVYAVLRNPNSSERASILVQHPALNAIGNKKLKVWFQNRRSRDRQRTQSAERGNEGYQSSRANRVLFGETDYLYNKLMEQRADQAFLRNLINDVIEQEELQEEQQELLMIQEEQQEQLVQEEQPAVQPITSVASTGSPAAAATADLGQVPRPLRISQPPVIIADNQGLCTVAEEIKDEFLVKTTGNGIDWKTALELKLPGPNATGAIYISETCIGMAARACIVIPFEPIKTIAILKDRRSWSRNCRNLDVFAQYPSGNGGTIELIYTQYYALTPITGAQDFWTLRYTTALADGSLLVCEKSIISAGTDVIPSSPAAPEFVRGKMMASGYLVRPCEGGSLLNFIEHVDLEASAVPQVVRPLYESSQLLAKTAIVSAISYIENMANETNDKGKQAADDCSEAPANSQTSLSRRLIRGFNDAISGFTEDGWTSKKTNDSHDIIISFNQLQNPGDYGNNYDSLICVKASLVLQNVTPAKLVTLLKERRSSWMSFNFAEHSSADSIATIAPFPNKNTHVFSETPLLLLDPTSYEDEVLEVIRFGRDHRYRHTVPSGDMYQLQICNGMEEDTGIGSCSELIFSPIDRTIPNYAVLLCSGFRVFSLGSNTVKGKETGSSTNASTTVDGPSSVVFMAFQFPYERHLQENAEVMAVRYIQHVISCVENISPEIIPSVPNPAANSTEENPAMSPANTPDSAFAAAAMDFIQASPPMGFTEASQVNGAMNFTEASPAIGPLITPEMINDAMDFVEANPLIMGSAILPDSVYDAMDFTGTSQAMMGPSFTPRAIDAGMNFTGLTHALGPIMTQNLTNVAMNPAGANTSMGPLITPDLTYVAMRNMGGANTPMGRPAITPGSTYDVTIANLLCESYRSNLGMEIIGFDAQRNNSILELINQHPYAILCFSFSSIPVCLYANQAGLNMVETTAENLGSFTVDKIFSGANGVSLSSLFPTIMNQGYVIVPQGYILSEMNNFVKYEQAVIWKVMGWDGSILCFAFAFVNWSILGGF